MKFTQLISKGDKVDVYRYQDMAIKLFHPEYAKADVLYEAMVHAQVEETGLPVPQILQVTKEDGQWSIALEYVEGQTIGEAMAAHPDKIPQYMDMLVKLHVTVHSKRIPTLPKLKDKLIRQIQLCQEIDENRKYELLTRLDGMPKHIKLCHGNFGPSNVLIHNGDIKIVDWIEASQGNASADAARTYLLFALEKKLFGEKAAEVAELYMNTFCKMTGTDKRYVQAWLPIVAAAHLSNARPEEHDLLITWLDVVDYD